MMRCITLAMTLVLLFSPFGCASKKHEKLKKPKKEVAADAVDTAPAPSRGKGSKTSLINEEKSTLCETVRKLGMENAGGVVVINGWGERTLEPFAYENEPYEKIIENLAQATQCKYEAQGSYFLLFPAGYETLLDVSVADELPARYRPLRLDLSIGDYTPLFDALALLGHSLGISIVADNLLAESTCGECAFHDAPFADVLKGLLQSARTAPGAFFVEATDAYIFLGTVGNPSPASALLNEEALNDSARGLLAKSVSLTLPRRIEPNKPFEFVRAPARLGSLLTTLSTQLGIPVEADPRLLDFPVNPCVFRNLSMRSAMDLLVRQWPLASFGYEVRQDTIYLRPRE